MKGKPFVLDENNIHSVLRQMQELFDKYYMAKTKKMSKKGKKGAKC